MLVVAADLVGADGRHLLHRRPPHKHHGGLWEFPGGKVEAGENCREALARELAEELGIVVAPADLHPLGFAESTAGGAEGAILLLLYRCRRWQGRPEALEGGVIQWFTPEAMATLPMPPLDCALFDTALRDCQAGEPSVCATRIARP